MSDGSQARAPRTMPFAKRPREETTVVYEGRTVIVEYVSTYLRRKKRHRIRFTVEGCREKDISFKAAHDTYDTLTEAEVQAAILTNLWKHHLALPPAEEPVDPDACAVDAGEDGDGGRTRACACCVCACCVCVCARWPHTPPPCGMLVGTVTWRKQPKREHSECRLYDPEAGPFFPGGRRQGSGQSQGGHGERGLRLAGVCARMCSYVSTPVTRFP